MLLGYGTAGETINLELMALEEVEERSVTASSQEKRGIRKRKENR